MKILLGNYRKPLLTWVGSFIIIVGLLANEWCLAPILGSGGPLSIASRIEIALGEIILVTVGIYILLHRHDQPNMIARRLKIVSINLLVTLALLEFLLRLLFSQQLYLQTQSIEFWQHDIEFGWSMRPMMRGVFSNGYFKGVFHTDENGNRVNSNVNTFVERYRNIIMIGDSVTASLEVDDNETTAAILEQQLRGRGYEVNVINFGVRGYGTDQSVRKAMFFGEKYRPTDIIYTYVSNDVLDNNVIRSRYFGKGVYYRPEDQNSFITFNYPVQKFDDRTRRVVLMDEACSPAIIARTGQTPIVIPSKPWYFRAFYTLRARSKLKNGLNERFSGAEPQSKENDLKILNADDDVTVRWSEEDRLENEDPFFLLRSGRVTADKNVFWSSMQKAYAAKGITRLRCRSYFDDQLRYLIKLLREIPSVERVHIVVYGFPVQKADVYEPNVNSVAFRKMRHDGIIDTLVELPSQKIPDGMALEDLHCPLDYHFCEAGNRWVAQLILENIDFGKR